MIRCRQQQPVLLLSSFFLLSLFFCFPNASSSPYQDQRLPLHQPPQLQYLKALERLLNGSASDVHAVVVSTSRQWHNYRHMTNALTFYSLLKQQGLRDGNIVLMLAGADGPCTPRNPFPAGVYRHRSRKQNLFGGHDICSYRLKKKLQNHQQEAKSLKDEIETGRRYKKCAAGARGWEGVQIDYAGDEVTVGALLSVLTGLQRSQTPKNKRLHSNRNSALVVFLSGHGGDEFLKFSDWEVLLQQQLTETVEMMSTLKRFKRMLLIAETCQAATLLSGIKTPGVLRISSSLKAESSFSFTGDGELGSALIDRWSHSVSSYLCMQANLDTAAAALEARERNSSSSISSDTGVGRFKAPVSALLESLDFSFLMAKCGVEEVTIPGSPSLVSLPLDAFFSRREKPIPFPFVYSLPLPPPDGDVHHVTPSAATKPLRLWHSEALRFASSLDIGKDQQQQQKEPHPFKGINPKVISFLAVVVAGAACLGTAAFLS